MNKLFSKIGKLIEKSPFKVLLVSLLVFAIMITGAIKINMATGDETLVKTSSQAYISNHNMQEEFGGDAIMVLIQGDSEDLLGQENIEKMWNVEARLKYSDEIYSFLSPSSIVHQITDRQSEEIKENIPDIRDGLGEMSEKLIEIGTELGNKDVPDPEEIEGKLDELMASMDPSSAMEGMLAGQEAQMAKVNKKLSDMTSEIEAEVAKIKEDLTGGIDPEELETMADGFVVMGENLQELSEGLETFYEKSPMMIPNIPQDQEELDNILYEDDGELRDMFSDVVIDDEHVMMMIKLDGNLEDDEKDILYEDVAQAMEAEGFGGGGFSTESIEDENTEDQADDSNVAFASKDEDGTGIEYIISGKPVLDSSLRDEMKSNMQFMVVSAAIVMTLVLFLVFKVRWRILSIGIILVAVIGTLGLMGHLSVPMTMVSMAVFPILIGLGIDFSIQFHNRYEEELSTTRTLTRTGRAVAIAVLASMLGFISLYISPVPMIQDFGKMLTIGVVVSFLASIFLLLPILNIRDKQASSKEDSSSKNSSPSEKDDGGLLGRILGRTAKFVTSLPVLILAIAIILSGLGLFADSKVGVETDIETFMPQDMEALKDIRYVRDTVGSTDEIVIYMEDENILSQSNISWIQNTAKDIEAKYGDQVDDVKTMDNLVDNISDGSDLDHEEYLDLVDDLPESQRSMFINEKRNKGAIIINIKHMDTKELENFVADLGKDLDDAPMDATVTGQSVLDVEMVEGLTSGRVKMTLLGIALVFLGLLAFYRNIFKAMIPVIPVILIVGMSGGIMYLLGLNYTPITATLGALILGMGTETTLMILERYLEEREAGKPKAEALNITVTRIGKATLSTELTTMGGFAVLIFSNFVILKDFGLMTVINVSLVLVSTFVVLPAVIWLLDRFIIKDSADEN